MNDARKRRIEFGDFQTPEDLAMRVCARLARMGMSPGTVVEPTCGVGAFVLAAARHFTSTESILGFDVNGEYVERLRDRLADAPGAPRILVAQRDFFKADWASLLGASKGRLLVLGNLPWVTNSTLGSMDGTNLPGKSNFQSARGYDAISGNANFDISETMLLEILRWFDGGLGDVAMLVKTSVARKVLSHVARVGLPVSDACIVRIDAKREFSVSVEACLLVVRVGGEGAAPSSDYTVFEGLEDYRGRRVGHRDGIVVGDLDQFAASSHLLGSSPQKWRSGVKHDLSAVMEFVQSGSSLTNGFNESVSIESDLLFPLMKGSDVGSHREWRGRFVLVPQHSVGAPTDHIERHAPRAWAYLLRHADALDRRKSKVYTKNPRFSIFGIGEYAFRPWKIAICGLYKHLRFRLVGPIGGRPVMFDDTVYFISFDTREDAERAFCLLASPHVASLLNAMIFWDDKRPIKSGILNRIDWSKANLSAGQIDLGRGITVRNPTDRITPDPDEVLSKQTVVLSAAGERSRA